MLGHTKFAKYRQQWQNKLKKCENFGRFAIINCENFGKEAKTMRISALLTKKIVRISADYVSLHQK